MLLPESAKKISNFYIFSFTGGSRTGHVPAVSDSEEKQEVQDG